MTRAQFLNDLYHRLESLTREQAEQHLTYYAEMLADRMEEGMSEEEAVSSMEDLDTIARRILEEEGLSAPAPAPAEPPAAPPAYPDASRIPGGGGTRAYQGPKKRDWRRLASVLLWVVAIVCLVGALGRWRSRSGHDASTVTAVAEGTDTVVQEALEEVVAVDEVVYYSDGGRTVYLCEIPADAVSMVYVNWTSGAVEVERWDGDAVSFSKLDEDWIDWSLEGGALSISSTSGALVLRIPAGLLSYLNVDTASADVAVSGADMEALGVRTISGDVSVEGMSAGSACVSTTSGDIRIDGLTADSLEISSTSGDVQGEALSSNFTGNTVSGRLEMAIEGADQIWAGTTSGSMELSLSGAPSLVDLRSRSGDISLDLPEDLDFALTFDTVSGDTDMDAACTRINGVYTRGGGGCPIYVVTTSGDLAVEDW